MEVLNLFNAAMEEPRKFQSLPVPNFLADQLFGENDQKIREGNRIKHNRPKSPRLSNSKSHPYLQFKIIEMSETTLSKRARKKQTREAGQNGPRSESVASDAATKEDTTTLVQAAIDSDFKPRDGTNPFIDVVQKKVRNLTKRRVLDSH
jgi:hypothetical protein